MQDAEKQNIEALAHMWVGNSRNPAAFNDTVKRIGHEKALADVRIIQKNFTRLSDGTVFVAIKGDNWHQGGKNTISAADLRVVDVSSPEIAENIRESVAAGVQLEIALQNSGFIQLKNDEPTPRKPTSGPGRIVDSPAPTFPKKHSSAPPPISPTGGSRSGNIKDPSQMSQPEYETWWAKGRGGGKLRW